MKIEHKELIVVGAGPAGLSAAIEAAKSGVKVIVFD
jgi:flavin-dependent dehydrogenase